MFHLAVIKGKQIKTLIKHHFTRITLAKIMIIFKANQILITSVCSPAGYNLVVFIRWLNCM